MATLKGCKFFFARMSGIQRPEECFAEIKPITDALVKSAPSISRANSKSVASLLNSLLTIIESISDPELVLTPTNTHLIIMTINQVYSSMTAKERRGYEVVIEPWLRIMYFLYSKTQIKVWMDPRFTVQLIIMLSNIIYDPRSDKVKSDVSEEIKLLVVDCLSVALPARYKEGRYDSFTSSPYYKLAQSLQQEYFVPIAGQCITGLLNTIKYEQNIQLRVKSIRVLSQLLQDNLRDIDLLAKILPGVVSKLTGIISQKAEKENHEITCAALDSLGNLIVSVMGDDQNDTLVEIHSFNDIFNGQENKKEEEKDKLRTKVWYNKTKESLAKLFGQILKLSVYPDWRARLAFVDFSYRILWKCSNTLDNCVKPLVEMLVLHTDDSFDEVANTCRNYMEVLKTWPSFERVIMPILKNDLYDWMMKFPQYVISRDEQEKTNMMTLISGFIILLGKRSESVLSNVLNRTSDGWMTALEIDRDSLNILEQKESQRFIELDADNNLATPVYPKIRFKHVINDHTVAKLNRLVNVIGKYCDLQGWIHHYMRYIINEDGVFNDPQAAFIIYALLSGALHDPTSTFDISEWVNDLDLGGEKDNHLHVITAQLLNDVMSVLTRTASNNEKHLSLISTNSPQLDEEAGYVLTVCFCLQLVGLASCILDQDYLEEQFINILYPLLAHLGSNNVFIHTYALITLDTIAVKCGLANAQELAISNIDYIINMISQHISVLSSNVRVPLVLKALIHVGGYATIGYLDDTVDEIFDALERYSLNEWICDQLCGVLLEIIQALEKNTSTSSIPDSKPKAQTDDSNQVSSEVLSFIHGDQDDMDEDTQAHRSMEEIGKYFLDRQNKGLHDNLDLEQVVEKGDLVDEQTKNMDEIAEEMNNTKEEPLTHEQEMAMNIMDKASYFLTASSPQLRSHVLTLLTSGVAILADHPNKLNPLVYKMWTSIVNRFDDQQNYVLLHTANLVEKISQVSTDFLTDKFRQDLWPRFKVILQKGVYAASSDVSSTGYSKYSVYHRTQKSLLETLTHIAYHVPLNQELVKDIVKESRYYYKNNQVHEELSNSCQDLFTALSTQQPDTVWLFTFTLDKVSYVPPSDILAPIHVPEWYFENYHRHKLIQ